MECQGVSDSLRFLSIIKKENNVNQEFQRGNCQSGPENRRARLF